MNGYKEASTIDNEINKLLKENPLSEENALEWMRFTRTVRSTLEIIEECAKNKIDAKTELIASEKSGNKKGYPHTEESGKRQ